MLVQVKKKTHKNGKFKKKSNGEEVDVRNDMQCIDRLYINKIEGSWGTFEWWGFSVPFAFVLFNHLRKVAPFAELKENVDFRAFTVNNAVMVGANVGVREVAKDVNLEG